MESGILLKIGIQNPSSTDKDFNPVPGIWNPRLGIHNPRLSWIPFYGAFEGIETKKLFNQYSYMVIIFFAFVFFIVKLQSIDYKYVS